MMSTPFMPSMPSFERVNALCRDERERAQGVFDRRMADLFAEDHPDSAEEPSDDMPLGRDFEDDGLDTTPTL